MSFIRSILYLFGALAFASNALANDGVYYMSGNQLVPIVETDISITRERLSLTKNGDLLDVLVEYEFQNPGDPKKLLVGFEAMSPQGDVPFYIFNGAHPYMHDFTVVMNGNALNYDVTELVSESRFSNQDVIDAYEARGDYTAGLYVYYFDANFQTGRNTITHSYSFDLSGSVVVEHDFDYVLTAANRWAGKGIGTFELEIDMGDMIEFQIFPFFFSSAEDWEILGDGKVYDLPAYYDYYRGLEGLDSSGPMFAMRTGSILFRKENFRPEGELALWVPRMTSFKDRGVPYNDARFDASVDILPFSLRTNFPSRGADEFSTRVLRNYLFARRGYVFSDPDLKAYFEKHPWYLPDPGYTADLSALSSQEQTWYQNVIVKPAE